MTDQQSAYSMTYAEARTLLGKLDYDPDMLDDEAAEERWLEMVEALPQCMSPVIAAAIRIFEGTGADPMGLVGNVPPRRPFPKTVEEMEARRIVPPSRPVPPSV